MELEKTTQMNLLVEFYGSLLTDKQLEYMELYYGDDYSLGEIAEEFDVSRQAVYDNIRRSAKLLENYEEKLHLVADFYKRQEHYDELEKENSNSDIQIGVYIVDTLDGKSIEEQANEVARSWKIGHSETNKGALIVIAINDRKFRIETSNELNTILTDSKAKRILDNSKSYMKNKRLRWCYY